MHILLEGLKYTRAAQIQSNTYSCGSNNSEMLAKTERLFSDIPENHMAYNVPSFPFKHRLMSLY